MVRRANIYGTLLVYFLGLMLPGCVVPWDKRHQGQCLAKGDPCLQCVRYKQHSQQLCQLDPVFHGFEETNWRPLYNWIMESPPTSERLPPPPLNTEAAPNDVTQGDVGEIPPPRMSSRRNSTSLDDWLNPVNTRDGVNFSVPEFEDRQFNPQLPTTGQIDQDIVSAIELVSRGTPSGARLAVNEVVAIPAAYGVSDNVVNDNEVAMAASANRIDQDIVGAHELAPENAPLHDRPCFENFR